MRDRDKKPKVLSSERAISCVQRGVRLRELVRFWGYTSRCKQAPALKCIAPRQSLTPGRLPEMGQLLVSLAVFH